MSEAKLKRWEILPSTGSHFDVLDGLRGVAILLVIGFHALYSNPADGVLARIAGYFIIAGWMGVPIFFVLSGFLISYPFFKARMADPQSWWPAGYGWRRVAKIIPPFYLSLILFTALYYLRTHDPAYFRSAFMWLTCQGAYRPIVPNLNGVYWSLMLEMQFYLVLPVFFFLTRTWSAGRTGTVIFLTLFLVPFLFRQQLWLSGHYIFPDYRAPEFGQLNFRVSQFLCQMDYFGWGVIFAAVFVSLPHNIMDKLRFLSLFGYAGALLIILALFFWGQWQDEFQIITYKTAWSFEFVHLMLGVGTMLMLFLVFDSNQLLTKALNMRWLRLTGIVSFEWFLFHGPIFDLFREYTPEHSGGNALIYACKTILPMLVTFGIAVFVYRYFSLPILHWARDRIKAQAKAGS